MRGTVNSIPPYLPWAVRKLPRKPEKKYKGRVVLRGDTVRDNSGHFAVFSEQGTSASHLAAAKFIDAIARFPGNDGSDSDAIGAYTQVPLKELEDSEGIETWISLPKNRRPESWSKFKDPVCKLVRNLCVQSITFGIFSH